MIQSSVPPSQSTVSSSEQLTDKPSKGSAATFRPFWLRALRAVLRVLVGAGILGLLLALLASFFAQQSFYAELLTHFRMQYLWVGFGLLAVSWWVTNRAMTWLVVLLLLPHLIQVAPYYYPIHWLTAAPTTNSPNAVGPQPLKIVSFNVYYRNHEYQETVDYLLKSDADLIAIIECTRQWEDAIWEGLKDQYPYRSREVLPGWEGNHIFSRLPLQSANDHPAYASISRAHRLLTVRSQWQGKPFLFSAVHPSSPDSVAAMQRRNHEFRLIAEIGSQLDEPIIFAGDFNCTSGSPYFRELIQASQLQDTRQGFGWQGSWPSFGSPILIPIDHVLVSRHWSTVYREVGPDLGSDHLPIYTELTWANKPD